MKLREMESETEGLCDSSVMSELLERHGILLIHPWDMQQSEREQLENSIRK